MNEQENLKLSDGRTVLKSDYIKAKTKDLQEFGYSDLTESDLEKSLNMILSNSNELDVIAHFIKDDLDLS